MSTQKVNGEASTTDSNWTGTVPEIWSQPTNIEVESLGDGKGYAMKKPIIHDAVNHPQHYCQGKIEVISFIEDQQLPHHEASAVAYICRARVAGHEIQDLKKAIWYLSRRISLLEKGTEAVSK